MTREQGNVLGKWLGAGIVFCAVITGAVSTFEVDRHPRTDDATVRANGIAFAPEVEGRLVALYVRDNQKIQKGDLLFEIDPRPYEYALEQAKANQAMLEGQINDARRRIATEQSAVGTAKAGVLGSLSGVSAQQTPITNRQRHQSSAPIQPRMRLKLNSAWRRMTTTGFLLYSRSTTSQSSKWTRRKRCCM